ncbi:MAG: hypothetical protein A2629_01815 [Candidatus Levybacteria bacterium RIFCSPHIGHO2_01_FULL_41_15]|nr:MAG: hypothetical protein A2629_01815 [Candidatus Levybacteria bacterium RIFCSPHIGHO2_01_FULL_41_15]
MEYYFSLILILGLGLLFILLAAPDRSLQFNLVVLTTVFYIFFGVIHHLINHDLSIKIMIEYVIIGTLGLALVFFFMKGGLGIF